MSDTGQNRFEIDLEEIERQLRRSAELGPTASAPSDPLAELARIVGQDDPFLSILGDARRPGSDRDRKEPTFEGAAPSAPVVPAPATPPPLVAAPPRNQVDALLTEEDRGVLGTAPLAADPVPAPSVGEPFDPVARGYGSREQVFDADEFTPMAPPRSRRKLGAVLALVALTGVGVAGALAWRNMGGGFVSSGPPPLIRADNAPLKVAPENPGGMDIPNQNRQIFEGKTDTARSRVLDRQEQPIDVREAARQMPAVPDAPAPPPATVLPGTNPTTGTAPRSATPPVVAALPPGGGQIPSSAPAARPGDAASVATAPAPVSRNPALNALGDPRRVRTVAVRPDGSAVGGGGGLMMNDPDAPVLPSGPLPPPVSVPTVAIPAGSGAFPQTAAVSSAASAALSAGAPTGPAIQVLPPQRPGRAAAVAEPEPVSTGAAAQNEAAAAPPEGAGGGPIVTVRPPARPARIGQRVAAADAAAEVPSADVNPGAGGSRTFAVQLATRPTEDAARTAYDQLSDKFATDLGGKPATVTQAQVSGRSVYRIRVTPLSREDANTLCTRLKASGGQCFVVAN